jgi:hypothetical protein
MAAVTFTIGCTERNALIEDGTGPGLEHVGGEFLPPFATVPPGGDAYLVRLGQLSRLGQFCQLKDCIDFID